MALFYRLRLDAVIIGFCGAHWGYVDVEWFGILRRPLRAPCRAQWDRGAIRIVDVFESMARRHHFRKRHIDMEQGK